MTWYDGSPAPDLRHDPPQADGPPRDSLPGGGAARDVLSGGGSPRDVLAGGGAPQVVLPVAGPPEAGVPAIGAPWDEAARDTALRDEPGRDEAARAAVGAGRARLRAAARAASVAVDARDRRGDSPGPGDGGRRAPGRGPLPVVRRLAPSPDPARRVAPGPGYDDGRGAPGPTGAGGSAGSGYADDGDVGSRGLGLGDDGGSRGLGLDDDGGSRGLGHADEVSSPDLGHDDGERAVADPGFDDEPERAERLRLADVVRWRLAPRTAAIALGALLLVGGAVALRSAAQPTGDPVAVEEPAVTRGTADTEGATTDGAEANGADTAAEDPTVWVHVVGRVAAPGVVALPEGSRVGDAVAAAGGALPDADLAGLNLAAVVQDGAQIRVPAPGEEPAADADDGSGGLSGPGGGGSGGAGGAVDVNTAGSAELQTLPGIGPVLADRIVAWRDANGPFPDVDALIDVSGIGPAVLGQIRDLVRV